MSSARGGGHRGEVNLAHQVNLVVEAVAPGRVRERGMGPSRRFVRLVKRSNGTEFGDGGEGRREKGSFGGRRSGWSFGL